MKFNNRQLRKISDQFRLASWVQGAIFYTDLHLFSRGVTVPLVSCLWVVFQVTALCIDRKVNKDDNEENGEIE